MGLAELIWTTMGVIGTISTIGVFCCVIVASRQSRMEEQDEVIAELARMGQSLDMARHARRFVRDSYDNQFLVLPHIQEQRQLVERLRNNPTPAECHQAADWIEAKLDLDL